MKRLSISILMLGFVFTLLSMSFIVKRTPAPRSIVTPAKHNASSRIFTHRAHKARDEDYYFYDTTDTFVDFGTADNEENNLEWKYGVLVDENSLGGTLLEEGYTMPGKPHITFPDIFLYGHFGH